MDNSPFNSLPPEIRDRIFGLAVRPDAFESPLLELDKISEHSALTRTCRQICAETLAVFYRRHNFTAKLENITDMQRLCALLELLGPKIVSKIPILLIGGNNPSLGYMSLYGKGPQPPLEKGTRGLVGRVPNGGIAAGGWLVGYVGLPKQKYSRMLYNTLKGMGLQMTQPSVSGRTWDVSLPSEKLGDQPYPHPLFTGVGDD